MPPRRSQGIRHGNKTTMQKLQDHSFFGLRLVQNILGLKEKDTLNSIIFTKENIIDHFFFQLLPDDGNKVSGRENSYMELWLLYEYHLQRQM